MGLPNFKIENRLRYFINGNKAKRHSSKWIKKCSHKKQRMIIKRGGVPHYNRYNGWEF
jgi:hypothetical protein